MKAKMTVTFHLANFICGVIGLTGVWLTTHNWYAMLWTVIAALHFSYTPDEKTQKT